MGILSRTKSFFSEAARGLPIATGFALDNNRGVDNNLSYSYNDMVNLGNDDRVNSLIALCSCVAYESVKGIYIEPEDIYGEDELDDKEKELVNEAIRLLRRIKIKEVFFGAAWNMIQFGDSIDYIKYDGNEVIDVIPLPIDKMTIVNEKSQVGNADVMIIDGEFYVLDEDDTDEDIELQMFEKDDIVHVSYNKRGQYRRDIMNRDTYNTWSKPAIYSLKTMVDWKKQSITTDIKWKRRMVPREHWSVNVDSITPEGFQGTHEEKIKKATDAIRKLVEDVKGVVDSPQPDQSVITTDLVKGVVLESDSANYKDPNEIIRQINSFLGTPLGVPESLLGGETQGAVGTTMSAFFSSMRMDVICDKLATEYEKVVRKHLGLKFPQYVEDLIPRVRIRIDSTLDQVMLEKSRIVLNMANAGLFSREEIRQMMGFNGIPMNPYKMNEMEEDNRLTRSSNAQLEKDNQEAGINDVVDRNNPSARRVAGVGHQKSEGS